MIGSECSNTVTTFNNLARLKYRMGDLDSTSQMFNRVLECKRSAFTENTYDLQVSLNNKTALLTVQNRFQETKSVLKDVLRMRESTLGPLHVLTLFTMKTLTDVLKTGDNTEVVMKLRTKISQDGITKQPLSGVGVLLRTGLLFN